MNDLAEKALVGLEVGYRTVREHALVTVGVLGFGVSSLIVAAGGRVVSARATRPLTTWFGVSGARGAQSDGAVPGAFLFAGVAALILLWLVTVEIVRRREASEAAVWSVVTAWGLPLAVGPPLFDTSVYSRVAFGLLQRNGSDPYSSAASALGFKPIVAAIEPGAREIVSSAGPVGSLIEHLSVSVAGGSPVGAVLVLRVVGVLSVIWIGRLAADMGGSRPARAVSLTALNPLALLLVVADAHLQGLAAALLLRTFAAANRRHWVWAVVLACIAGSLVPASFVVAVVVVAVHLHGRHVASTRRVLARDLTAAVVTVGGFGLAVPNGFAWVRTVADQFAMHTPYSIVEATSKALSVVVRPASYDDLIASSRLTAIIAMVCVLAYLVVSAGSRPLERSAGYALLTVALLAPVLHPWYLVGAIMCIAPSADAAHKIWAMSLSCAGCLLLTVGFGTSTANLVTGLGLAVVAVVTAVSLRRQAQRGVDDGVSLGAE